MNFCVEKLNNGHKVENFNCGEVSLNRFLVRYAMANQLANSAMTYVGLSDETVIGFYSLTVGEVFYDDAPERLRKGLAKYPIPVMLLARLAIDEKWQGKGLGSGLLRDAIRRTVQAADIAGIRAMVVHAKDDVARKFYEHFNFAPSLSDPLHLYVLIKDLRVLVGL